MARKFLGIAFWVIVIGLGTFAFLRLNYQLELANKVVVDQSHQVEVLTSKLAKAEAEVKQLRQDTQDSKELFYGGFFSLCRLSKGSQETCNEGVKKMVTYQLYQNVWPMVEKEMIWPVRIDAQTQ